ncbi:MAG TPA: helix-turn-helix transcriptional regulator [Chitinophagaceae bacterium]|nr:helix-turn-helix transcriptional regulator [Chitinophagaceae bacterium]
MQVAVKNMVCQRCIAAARQVFEQAGIPLNHIELGRVETGRDLSAKEEQQVKHQLQLLGFEWLDDRQKKLVEEVKKHIVELVHYGELDELKEPLSAYLGHKMKRDYTAISKIFSEAEPYTIEQFFILQKIEKVKEWLVYSEHSLGEIAFRLGYSSVAHLSAQFKKITGFTPSQFRRLKDHHRKPIDRL